jgi:hypothetical protein
VILRGLSILFSAAAGLFFFATEVHAYLDPGSGSYIIQILLGSLVAGFFVIKQYWQRLKSFFKGRNQQSKDDD